MKNHLIALFLLLTISAVGQNPAFQKIDQLLSGLAKEHQFSGSVLVAWKGEVFKKGYGMSNREAQVAFTPQTISCIGSVTKQFTGAAILKLEMMGKLSVQDPITKYFDQVPADKKGITLHHLLTHSAGFAGAIGDDYESIDRDSFARLAFSKPLLFEPGKQYEYSNVGFSLLGIVIEKITGASYEVFLNKYLFKPAGMAQTGYVIPKWKAAVATGYRGEKNWGKINEKNWAADGPYWHLRANGGILSNVEDLYKWHQALASEKILSKVAKTKYYTKHIAEGEGADSYYGYGWAIFDTPRNTTLIAHNGGNGIYFCDFLRYVDEDLTVILLTNATRREWNRLANVCARTCFDPNFVPEIKVSGAGNNVSLDQHPNRELIQTFLRAITSGNEETIKALIDNTFAPGFKDGFPMAQHLSVLKQMGGEIKGLEVDKLNVSGPVTVISFKNSPLKINFEVEEGKIAGIGVDN